MVSNVSSTSNVDYINMNISSMDSGSDGNHKGFLLMIHVIQEIPNIYSENIFTILRNKHSTPLILINKTINFCEFMVDKSKNLFLQSFFDEENGQYPNGCPVKKVIVPVNDFSLIDFFLMFQYLLKQFYTFRILIMFHLKHTTRISYQIIWQIENWSYNRMCTAK